MSFNPEWNRYFIQPKYPGKFNHYHSPQSTLQKLISKIANITHHFDQKVSERSESLTKGQQVDLTTTSNAEVQIFDIPSETNPHLSNFNTPIHSDRMDESQMTYRFGVGINFDELIGKNPRIIYKK